jgi:hypothetical protein
MTDSDELLSKADALLARWRSGTTVAQPPADYPVLTEVVEAPGAAGEAVEILELDFPDGSAPATLRPPAAAAPIPLRSDAVSLPQPRALNAAEEVDVQALEERVRLRVLDAIEPYIGAFLEEPLRLRLEDLARQLAVNIAGDARNDILSLVREAVRNAVAQELAAQRDAHSSGEHPKAASD